MRWTSPAPCGTALTIAAATEGLHRPQRLGLAVQPLHHHHAQPPALHSLLHDRRAVRKQEGAQLQERRWRVGHAGCVQPALWTGPEGA